MTQPHADRERPGRFSASFDAPTCRVSVRATSAGLEIRDELGLLVASWKTADLRSDGALPGGGVRLRCVAEAGARLEVGDAALFGETAPPAARSAERLWSRSWVQAVAVTLLGLGFVSVPFLLRPTDLTPQSTPAASLQACHGRAGEAALAGLVARLTAGLPSDRRPRSVAVADRPAKDITALADGTVVLPAGLLRAARGADEVAEALARALAPEDFTVLLRQAGIGTNRPPALRDAEWQALLRICR
ncbi:MAG: hypothetical protein HYU60_05690 [Magnetospirillum sp.]|nr:hypothetical protein [Magnetospirillum sp.]